MTRRTATATRQIEDKLQATLKELKSCKSMCDKLIIEREDSESEIVKILEQNKSLRSQLSGMNDQLMDTLKQRDELRRTVDEFDKDRASFEEMLGHSNALKDELREAYSLIDSLHLEVQSHKLSETQSLFDELVSSDPIMNKTLTSLNNHVSKNHRRKIRKINKCIKKTKLAISNNCKIRPIISVNKRLIKDIKVNNLKFDKSKMEYECKILEIQEELQAMTDSLNDMTVKYKMSQGEIRDHTAAMDELLRLSQDNMDRFESYTNNYQCKCQLAECSTSLVVAPESPLPTIDSDLCSSNSSCSKFNNNFVMYSDELGKDLGWQLSLQLDCSVTNNCYPGHTYKDILDIALKAEFKTNSIVILLIGRRGNVNKRNLINYFERLKNVKNVTKVIAYTLPYSKNVSENEDNKRYSLNRTLHTMSVYDNFLQVIDANTIISRRFYLDQDSFYLNKFTKRRIASSLSYFILNLVNSLTKLTTASFEQHYVNCLEVFPNNINLN